MDRYACGVTRRLRTVATATLLALLLQFLPLPAASPAHDVDPMAVSNLRSPVVNGLAPFSGIDSVEASPATVTVNSFADEPRMAEAWPWDCNSYPSHDCTLRAAIMTVNNNSNMDGATIALPAGTYTLTIPGRGETAAATGDLNVTRSLTLRGASAETTIINGNGLDGVLQIGSGVTVTISDVTIRGGNSTTAGGGITNDGVLTVSSSSISGNTGHFGGGIKNDYDLSVANSTLSDNTASSGGGALFGFGALTNVTISGNHADYGGGIWASTGTFRLNNVTITGNQAAHNGSGLSVISPNPANAWMKNTIIANGMGTPNCYLSGGTPQSLGGNVSGDASCASFLTQAHDRNNTDPRLGPLLDNGGPTLTHALMVGSWAIDNAVECTTSTDQRGAARPHGPACDSGAFESILRAPCATRPPVGVVVARSMPGTLQATITSHTDTYTPTNALTLLQFTRLAGATVEIGGQQHTAPFQYTVPGGGATSAAFAVRRAAGSSSATVELTASDVCGPWKTLVGGGPQAFAGGGQPPAPPAAEPATSCTPRPKLVVVTAVPGPGRLQVTVTVPTEGTDHLLALRFGAATNAQIEAQGQRGPGGFTVSLPGGSR